MPDMMTIPDRYNEAVPIATEAELLEFANKVRAAGGANALEALLPSSPCNPNTCLIANALNFECTVTGPRTTTTDEFDLPDNGDHNWVMAFPENMSRDKAQAVADAVKCPLTTEDAGEEYPAERLVIVLPDYITHAAQAFDDRIAFQAYVSVFDS